MTKKLLALMLVLAAAALAACGGGGGGGGGKELALVAGVKGDEFYITMNCGAQAEAKKEDAKLSFQGPDKFDPSLQTPVLDAVSAKRPDAILIAPTDDTAMYAPIKKAEAQGSKIVLVDTTLKKPTVAASQVATNNVAGGTVAAKTLARLVGDKGTVMVVNVNPGITTTDDRQKGFETEMKKHPGINYIGAQFDKDDPARAASIVTSTLAKHPDLKGIFATNLFSAEGSATGLRESGKLGKVKIVGYDAGPKQVSDLKSGLVQALVIQKPADIGRIGVQQAVKAASDKSTTKKIGTGLVVATRKTMNDPNVSKWFYKSRC
jgi:ribose transport system substrate-binding protein